jgi:site-specific DNA-methyltransferase (adenine-specific)
MKTPISNAYNRDCMEALKEFPDKYFELAIVDPPYNVGLDYNTHDDSMDNYFEWCSEWFSVLMDKSKCIVMTPGLYNLKYWINKDPLWQMIWYKSNSCTRSKLKGYMLYEPVLIWGDVANRIYKDVIELPISIQPDADFHPCPKPLKLWKRLIKDFGSEGCKVVEPFMGSGTGRIAAYQMGFDFWGYEIDKEYFEAQEKRFKEAIKQQSLFGYEDRAA